MGLFSRKKPWNERPINSIADLTKKGEFKIEGIPTSVTNANYDIGFLIDRATTCFYLAETELESIKLALELQDAKDNKEKVVVGGIYVPEKGLDILYLKTKNSEFY